MSVKDASARYTNLICPSVTANLALRKAVATQIEFNNGSKLPAPVKAAAKTLGAADEKAAQGLVDPATVWPENVSEDVKVVATTLYNDASVAVGIASSDIWFDWEFSDLSQGHLDADSRLRLALGLPPSGQGC